MRPETSSKPSLAAAALLLCLWLMQPQGQALQPTNLLRLVTDRCGSGFAANLTRNDTFLVFLPEGMQRLTPESEVRRCSVDTSGPCRMETCRHYWNHLPEQGLAHSESKCISPSPTGSMELEHNYACGNLTVRQTATEVLGSCQGVAIVRSFSKDVRSCRVMRL
ncbi:hypothetical protein BOX15_Mlig018202g2 [Macrostomum lignano]|uniref:SUEL-type lectin domain-containing protein n=2 Tax=Macrostomum lignano TaxID=282301 RepID=A0A267E5W3_9PLAT|nr:hypothetical protein BOX15_Mlig018202g2 [Macrostomum lignano]